MAGLPVMLHGLLKIRIAGRLEPGRCCCGCGRDEYHIKTFEDLHTFVPHPPLNLLRPNVIRLEDFNLCSAARRHGTPRVPALVAEEER